MIYTRPSRRVLVLAGIMFDYNQRMMSFLEDRHKLERGESSPNLQLCESPMQPAENARVVACNKENLEPLETKLLVEHGYEMVMK